ncbi:MAG: ABC transporter permease [Firmicutes bacterium]|nr:ABC transporter permease [Bacillota bacterium]
MKRFIIRRVLSGILTVLIVFVLNFVIIKAAPGDPISTLMGKDNKDPAMRAALEEKYGLNKPMPVQLVNYLTTAMTGDLGSSMIYNKPVTTMIEEKLGATVLLGLTSALISAILGTLMGIVAARREGSVYDFVSSGTQYFFNSVPSFWLALMLIIIFSSKLNWFPSFGYSDARANYEGMAHIMDVAKHMFLPCLTMVLILIPTYFRIAKSSVLQVSNEDFITTMKATGMDEGKIFRKYVFRNAILPSVTIFGISMAYLLTGVTLVEIVFAWPGMGRLTLTAINQRDYPTLMGVYLVMSISVAVVMLIVDVIYAYLDPRIRYD